MVLNTEPVCSFSTVTSTPGNTAPLGSVMVPPIEPADLGLRPMRRSRASKESKSRQPEKSFWNVDPSNESPTDTMLCRGLLTDKQSPTRERLLRPCCTFATGPICAAEFMPLDG